MKKITKIASVLFLTMLFAVQALPCGEMGNGTRSCFSVVETTDAPSAPAASATKQTIEQQQQQETSSLTLNFDLSVLLRLFRLTPR